MDETKKTIIINDRDGNAVKIEGGEMVLPKGTTLRVSDFIENQIILHVAEKVR